ncbi:hypothetical protein HQ865_02735 [Mucilaginibacter mali]|uniref:DNA mismatch repair proteins mutS family domain-containing protein n=1 Tax=Mucilaginibacter mali TaxID=2740462 RepID=A0A7D4U931_9SPHI|nr:hypothetical protein [Mucilaginibacter mali]QKJ28718.1 hypothetical protein HQ865_02735 [Mucilaginibacter mali]
MGIAVVIVIAIILLLVILTYAGNIRKRNKRLAAIRENWGKPADHLPNFKQVALYLQADPDQFRLSAATMADLDIEQVFTYIDRTCSKPGQQYLYNRLLSRAAIPANINNIDKQVDALPADKSVLETYQLQLAELSDPNAYYLPELFKAQESLFSPLVTFYIRVSGITVLALFMLMIATHNQLYFIVLMLMVMANFVIHYVNKRKVAQYTHSLPQLIKLINAATWFRKQTGTPVNQQVSDTINHMGSLKRSLSFVSINSAVRDPTDVMYALSELIKTLLLLEPLMFISSINLVNKYRPGIHLIFDYIGHIDFLISIRSVRDGLAYYSKPVFSPDSDLDIRELYHPLVTDCVANSINTSADRGVLVTGSNMSGKTTFIRSIAINALLAQTMFTSCSKSYSAPWLNIYTSIRISDDMEEHKSYFQAEALSVLDIMQQCDAAKPNKNLVLIDEIFRGTNTIERIAAAKAVLAYLTANGNFVFVSTHDLELAELLGSDYTTYSFEELVTADARLVFDYRMKPGLLKNKNGIAILQAMGYPQSVVDDAGLVSEQLRAKYQL